MTSPPPKQDAASQEDREAEHAQIKASILALMVMGTTADEKADLVASAIMLRDEGVRLSAHAEGRGEERKAVVAALRGQARIHARTFDGLTADSEHVYYAAADAIERAAHLDQKEG